MATQTAWASISRSLPRRTGDWVALIVLIIGALLFMVPFYVMVVNGLKSAKDVSLSNLWTLPAVLDAGGFSEAWERLRPNMWNSMQMVTAATLISSMFGALNGYVFSKWRFRGSDVLFTLLLFGFFIPYQSILIPLMRFLQMIGLYGTVPGLVIVHVVYGLPVTTLIFRNYFSNVPVEIIEAARMDGAGVVGIFRHVMLPLSPPAFVVCGIFQFTSIWNDFLFGVTIVPGPTAQPVTVALYNLSGSFSIDWNVVMAGAVIAALPTAIIYVLMGRYFIQGLLAGSVKN